MAQNNSRRNNNSRNNNNGNAEQGIVNSWSLMAFASKYKSMHVAPFVNDDGDEFTSCVFTEDTIDPATGRNKLQFVGFSSNLGELTAEQIAQQKNELQVVELESGYMCLCKQGASLWDEVNLF